MRRKLIDLLQQIAKRLRYRVPAVRLVEDQVYRAGRYGHSVIVIVNQRAPVFNGHLDVLALEFRSILIAQDGQKQLVAQGRFERLPVDVEIFGIPRSVAVLQHVLPPDGVVANAHVIGNNVEQQSQTLALQLRREAGKALVAAKLGVEAVVPRDIVPVHAVRPGFEDGRGVKVSDAELVEIAHDCLCVGKGEVFVHLHPVGRDRNPGIGVQHPLDAFPHFVGGFLARVGFYRGRLRHGYAR